MVTSEMKQKLRECAHADQRIASAANREIAANMQASLRADFDARTQRQTAVNTPLKPGIMNGDIYSWIYTRTDFEPGQTPEWPLDFVSPGTEGEFVAYTMPSVGRIPQRNIDSDYLMVQTYIVASSIDYSLDYARDARWDIVGRAKEVLNLSVTRKLNTDAWRMLLTAAYNRNYMIYDADAQVGQFTKRLVSLLKTEVARRGGGNSASAKRFKLTDLAISLEGVEDMRSWGVDQLDEVSRREIYVAADGSFNRIFGVNLHPLYELGVGQEFQKYYTDVLGGTLATGGDTELVLGLDLTDRSDFVMPMRDQWEVFEDVTMHREWRQGWYGRMRLGFGILDDRHIMAGSF